MGMVQAGCSCSASATCSAARSTPAARATSTTSLPGYVATIVLFTGGGVAVAVAQDRAEGFHRPAALAADSRYSIVAGRTLADFTTNAWSILFTARSASRSASG